MFTWITPPSHSWSKGIATENQKIGSINIKLKVNALARVAHTGALSLKCKHKCDRKTMNQNTTTHHHRHHHHGKYLNDCNNNPEETNSAAKDFDDQNLMVRWKTWKGPSRTMLRFGHLPMQHRCNEQGKIKRRRYLPTTPTQIPQARLQKPVVKPPARILKPNKVSKCSWYII